MFKKTLIIMCAVLFLFGLVSTGLFAENYKFALVVHVAGTPFWAPVKKGAADAAKLLGIQEQFMGPEEFNIQKRDLTVSGLQLQMPKPLTGR